MAGIGDSASYGFIGSFLLYFLTAVAGVSAILAGLVSSLGSLWNMLYNPVIGYISDHSTNQYGRRRPFILAGAFATLLAIILLFYSLNVSSDILKTIYYAVMAVFFWTGFSTFSIPYMALGAELTSDYDERTKLRAYTSIFYMIGGLFGMVMPTGVVAFVTSLGFSLPAAWRGAAAAVAFFTFFPIVYTWIATKGAELPKANREALTQRVFAVDMIKEYGEIIALKPMRYLIAGSIIFLIASTMTATGRMYFVTYNMQLPTGTISFVYLYATLIGLVVIPIIGFISVRIGKRRTYIMFMMTGAASALFFGFYDMKTIPQLFIYLFFSRFAASAYWQLVPSMNYDICEVDEFVSGKRREGTIASVTALAESLSSSIALLILGFILHLSGFDGDTALQSQIALDWMRYTFTYIPAIFMALSAIAIYLYPLTKENFNRIKAELEKKRRGEEVSQDGIEKVLK